MQAYAPASEGILSLLVLGAFGAESIWIKDMRVGVDFWAQT